MSFNKENLSIATNHIKAGVVPSVWTYYNEDGDSVIASEYFVEPRLTVGDIINVYDANVTASKAYRVSAKSTDTFKATVIALAAQLMSASASEIVTAVSSLYDAISLNTVVSLLVTTAANTSSTFTTSASANNYITLTKNVVDGVHFVLTTATTLPAGLALATDYYAVNSNGMTCQLSLTRGGDAVAITGAGTGAHTATVQKNYFTLADGYPNQRKIIKVKTDGGVDAVILPDNLSGGSTITAGDANDAMELIFVDDEWHLVKNLGVAIG
jgi:hypothetical protein